MMFSHIHLCVKNLRQYRQCYVSTEIIPVLNCNICGERFSVSEFYDPTIYYSEITDPTKWDGLSFDKPNF